MEDSLAKPAEKFVLFRLFLTRYCMTYPVMQLTAHLDASVLVFWKATLPVSNTPFLKPMHVCVCWPLSPFPNLLKPAAGRFQPGFYCTAAGVFSLPHDRPRRFTRQESVVHNKQEELTHEGMQGFGDTLDSWSELQSCHRSNEGRQAKESPRESASRSFDDRLKCSCKRIKCDTDSCMDALLSCLQVILCRFWKKLLCSH